MTNEIDDIGTFIRELRRENSLTIANLASKSGVSGTFISQVENGQRNPSPEILGKLAEPLGITKNRLLAVAGYIENDELEVLLSIIYLNHQALQAAEKMIIDLEDKLKNLDPTSKEYKFYEDELKEYKCKRKNFVEALDELNKRHIFLLNQREKKGQDNTVKQHINLNDDNEGNFVFLKNNKELPEEIQNKLRALIKLTLD